jgi:putative DNA modification/repair radical SAM protein
MDVRDKLNLLGQAAQYDDCMGRGLFAPTNAEEKPIGDMSQCISHLTMPDGRRKPILKVLQTSACQHNCRYCAFRAGRDFRRATFQPDELARAFDLVYRSGIVEGLFLSSGVIGTGRTMDQMIATVELIRGRYAFRGYVHLKLLPGAEIAHIERAVALADRVSVNLEAPTSEALAVLAPQKQLAALTGPLLSAHGLIRALRVKDGDRASAPGRGALGMSTQFVVGPAGESDWELLSTAQTLYRHSGVSRAYYSAFNPVPHTPLEDVAPTNPRREFRLYQADFLLRRYGFSADELPYDAQGRLDETLDPKSAWARAHPESFPLEVNRASPAELMRVPGIGPASAQAIIRARRSSAIRGLDHLRRLGARADQAAPFILLAGSRPPYQLPLTFEGEIAPTP